MRPPRDAFPSKNRFTMDFTKNTSSNPEGMKNSLIDFIFSVRNPEPEITTGICSTCRRCLSECPPNVRCNGRESHKRRMIRKFFRQGGHLKMEKADTLNNTEWFDRCLEKGYLPAMLYHRGGIGDVFDMSNFDKWVIDLNLPDNFVINYP